MSPDRCIFCERMLPAPRNWLQRLEWVILRPPPFCRGKDMDECRRLTKDRIGFLL